MKRLTINSDLQIFFDENEKARYSSTRFATIESVEQELYSWQAFVEVWLSEAEEPKPQHLSLLQDKVRQQVAPLARLFRRKLGMTDEQIRSALQNTILPLQERYPQLSFPELEAVMEVLCRGEK